MSEHVAHYASKMAAEAIEHLDPLSEVKSEALAFFVGLAFGAIGIAIYFRSLKDFVICLAIFLGMTVIVPMGPGEVVGWLFAPAYGLWRARTSNEKFLV